MASKARQWPLLVAICLLCGPGARAEQRDQQGQGIEIPAQNARNLRSPPEEPGEGDLTDRARALFQAIQNGDPASARDFFFPREPFLELKGIPDPDRYWHLLMRHYEHDIRQLRDTLPGVIEGDFVRFEMGRRDGWVPLWEEGNALPYFCTRHSWIYYRAQDQEHRFEIRTLITWGQHWYITHLI